LLVNRPVEETLRHDEGGSWIAERLRALIGEASCVVKRSTAPTVKIEPGLPRTEHMAVYFARWKDGSFSIVEADDEDEAYELLDEFGDEPAELSPLKSCLIDFELTDRGSFRLRDFGEVMRDEIRERGYPLLQTALQSAAAQEYDPEPHDVPEDVADVPPDVAKAIKAERERFAGFRPGSAGTELGKDIQEHTNTSGRNVDAMIKRKATEKLAALPVDKRKKPN
jgi:hypothetical protein